MICVFVQQKSISWEILFKKIPFKVLKMSHKSQPFNTFTFSSSKKTFFLHSIPNYSPASERKETKKQRNFYFQHQSFFPFKLQNLNYKINKTFNAKSASDASPSSFFLGCYVLESRSRSRSKSHYVQA